MSAIRKTFLFGAIAERKTRSVRTLAQEGPKTRGPALRFLIINLSNSRPDV